VSRRLAVALWAAWSAWVLTTACLSREEFLALRVMALDEVEPIPAVPARHRCGG
jgi:hypothetical protein